MGGPSPRSDFLVFGAPAIEQAEIDEVLDSLHAGWLGSGPKVAAFERAFADFKGVDESQVAGVHSCTAALHLSLLAAGLQPGDEVITTPLTFCATVNAIIHAGCTPVLADIDPDTMNLAPDSVREALTPRTRGIVPVHFAGRPCEMDTLCGIAAQHELTIIEDCAHAIESLYKGRPTGLFGDFGCFSFYVTKNVACGEGGMVIAKNPERAARIKTLALHGLSKDAWRRYSDAGHQHYFVMECGFKYNMMDLQAAIGIHQLERVMTNWERRREIWERYNTSFEDLPLTLPAPATPEMRHAYHLYTVLVDEERAGISRDTFLDAMIGRNIGVGVHYLSLPEHPYYQQRFGWKAEDYPNAMRIGRQTVSLPLSPKLTDGDVDDVVAAVQGIFS